MRSVRPRFLFKALMIGTLLATQTGIVAAQITGPLDPGQGVAADIPATEEVVPVEESPPNAVDATQVDAQLPESSEPVQVGEEPLPTQVEPVQDGAGELPESGEPVQVAEDQILAQVETVQGDEPLPQIVQTAPDVGDELPTLTETVQDMAEQLASPEEQVQVQEQVTDSVATVDEVTGPIDAIEVLGGQLVATVVEEAPAELTGPIDAIEVLGGQLVATVVEEAPVELTGPIDAIEVLGGQLPSLSQSVEEVATQVSDSVETVVDGTGGDSEAAVENVHDSLGQSSDTEVIVLDTLGQLSHVIETVQDVVGQVQDAVGAVEEFVGQLPASIDAEAVADTPVSDPAETVQDAVGEVSTSFDSVVEEGGAQTPRTGATVEGTAGLTAATVSPVERSMIRQSSEGVSAIEKTLAEKSKTVSGTTGQAAGAAEFSASRGDATNREGGTTFTRKWMTGEVDGWTRGRGVLRFALVLGASQPSLALLVDAVNDADGDGIFSDPETAPVPDADVSFKALISNIGATNFVIAAVTHTYTGATGPVQVRVCGELAGITLAPGETLACTFSVLDYSPVRGERAVSSVMAAAFEAGKGARRGASDSDSSTVNTLLATDEVLAVAIKRNLAFTGTDAARLLALALVLLAAGGGLLYSARIRSRRPIRPPVRSETSLEMLGWWTAAPARPHWKRHRAGDDLSAGARR